jgi:hypothetical protein
MTARLLPPTFRALDGNGNPISGAKLYIYEAGTSTPIDTYSDSALSSANDNPIIANSVGLFGDMFVGSDDYKVIFTDGAGGALGDLDDDNILDTWDDIEIASAPTLSLTKAVNAQTGTTYTVQSTDRSKLITISNANSIAITLPQADSSNFPNGWYVEFSNIGAGVATITPTTSTIDDASTYIILPGKSVGVTSDGTNYNISAVAGKVPGLNAQTGTTYTILTTDLDKLVTLTNSSATAVTLPEANSTTFSSGWRTTVENKGAGIVTITPTTSTIDGAATLVLHQNEGAEIFSDGTNYSTAIKTANSRKLITTTTASGASTVDLTIDSSFRAVLITGSSVTTSADGVAINFQAQVGGVYATGYNVEDTAGGAATFSSVNSTGTTLMPILQSSGTGTGENTYFGIEIDNPGGTSVYKNIIGWVSAYNSTPATIGGTIRGTIEDNAALTNVRISPASGTISGTFKLYGLR